MNDYKIIDDFLPSEIFTKIRIALLPSYEEVKKEETSKTPIEIFHPEVVQEVIEDYDHPLRQRLRENDLYDWAPQSPTRIIHSYGDELVPYENSEIAYNHFIQNGSPNVELSLVEFGSHQDVFSSIPKYIPNLKSKKNPILK